MSSDMVYDFIKKYDLRQDVLLDYLKTKFPADESDLEVKVSRDDFAKPGALRLPSKTAGCRFG